MTKRFKHPDLPEAIQFDIKGWEGISYPEVLAVRAIKRSLGVLVGRFEAGRWAVW